jgi:hypothetical protein
MSASTRQPEIGVDPEKKATFESRGNSFAGLPRARFFLAVIATMASIGAVFSTTRRAQADTVQDGDVVIDNISGATDTIISHHGSVTINNKIDNHWS